MTEHELIGLVANEYEVTFDDILGRRRTQRLVDARQMAVYMIYCCFDMSTIKIGRIFNRNSSVVSYTIDKIHTLISIDKYTRAHYNNLMRRVKDILNGNAKNA